MAKIDPIAKLQKLVDASTIKEVAENVGVSPPYISAVLKGERPPSEKILTFLGYKRKVRLVEYDLA